jgi:hypothetical protein
MSLLDASLMRRRSIVMRCSIHRIRRGYEGQVDLNITQGELRLHAPFRILQDA